MAKLREGELRRATEKLLEEVQAKKIELEVQLNNLSNEERFLSNKLMEERKGG